MGLDVYVGSLTRYYSRDWETVVQKYARETGLALQVVRPAETEDAVTDPETIRSAVYKWLKDLNHGLGQNLSGPLDWDESADSPYFTDKPTWDCYSSLLLWAAYLEHPDLVRPISCVEDWSQDEAFRRSSEKDFSNEYPALLRNTQTWLPANFKFTFACADLTGNIVNFGSVIALRDELAQINARTWGADASTLVSWRRDGADHLAPLEVGARFAFAIFFELANAAITHRLVMKLDY